MSTTNDANADQITSLYQSLLGRAPDQPGLQYWDDTGLSTQGVQSEFFRSPEYKSSVQGLYSDVLGRQPDSAGLNYWQNSGLGVPQIKQELFQSPEYNTGIANMYRSVLGRQPDAPGQMYWQTSGVGLPDMAQQFMKSPEYVNDGTYASNLIASLRAKNTGPDSNNPGVKLLDNPQNSALTLDFNKPVPTGLTNRPEKFVTPISPASPPVGGGGGGGGGGGSSGGDANASQISQIYRDILEREPDPGGLKYWDETGLGVDDIRNSFLNSPEKVGDANADEITALYREIFGREPDAGGLSYWDQTGRSYSDIRNAFLGSEEKQAIDSRLGQAESYRSNAGDSFDQNVYDAIARGTYVPPTNAGDVSNAGASNDAANSNPLDANADQITALYQDIFGRDPDAGGLSYWDQTGLGVDDIANSFRASPEYSDLTSSSLDANANQIADLYRELLGREPDEAGLAWWDQTGMSVDDIASGFLASPEYAALSGGNAPQDDQAALEQLILATEALNEPQNDYATIVFGGGSPAFDPVESASLADQKLARVLVF